MANFQFVSRQKILESLISIDYQLSGLLAKRNLLKVKRNFVTSLNSLNYNQNDFKVRGAFIIFVQIMDVNIRIKFEAMSLITMIL